MIIEFKLKIELPDNKSNEEIVEDCKMILHDAVGMLTMDDLTCEQKVLMKAIPDEFLKKIRDLPFVESIEFGEFYDGNNVLVRVSDMSVQNVKKIHEIEYDLAQNFGGYVSILVLPVKDL